MKYNYELFIQKIGTNNTILLYEEDQFIQLLCPSIKNGSMLIEECPNYIIVWNNEFKFIDYQECYSILKSVICAPIYFVFVENIKEKEAIINMGAIEIDFTHPDYEANYRHYGSYKLT